MIDLKKDYDFLGGEVLLFDKNLDWTSFDLVQRVRNSLCRKMEIKKLKVGHAGTLDPLATGLMILCTGKATKQIESFQNEEKEYIATLKLGATTPSFDMETEEDSVFDYSHVTLEIFVEAAKKFVGEIDQVPPIFSAVKVKGKRAFEYARNGEELKLKSRKIEIKEIFVESFSLPIIKIKVVCSKGTYIRSLARDIGKELNCGAYLTDLRRTRIGKFDVEDAFNINFFLDNLGTIVTN
ncbi:MAG: tRNA pseudouridine(55) synthase TruB [Prolixibacteraceae bacterium]|jgi:tRNA pseudouridine55 synthase|nr:tRNA pseudouridine(55) synthase TruB [Prolixibacteraceae bacterium]MBT6007402.1 tRNA pseudouridine(55) synthase TruB [Prolixibacteraceae bacterium]MBT6763784.1 tRNA pseudouridine(55) synthase TruB [Prolixibacteraceae bacterium]MBT7001041.1 tRNA pseudouridine(55) synthase TruB [Prolixibacteraceae bacterium]MBT7393671.1 tRNA pseudouridine(55) synthase TruB [Prolixibacteraceae bacterium]